MSLSSVIYCIKIKHRHANQRVEVCAYREWAVGLELLPCWLLPRPTVSRITMVVLLHGRDQRGERVVNWSTLVL